jgi:hypothetical protein
VQDAYTCFFCIFVVETREIMTEEEFIAGLLEKAVDVYRAQQEKENYERENDKFAPMNLVLEPVNRMGYLYNYVRNYFGF